MAIGCLDHTEHFGGHECCLWMFWSCLDIWGLYVWGPRTLCWDVLKGSGHAMSHTICNCVTNALRGIPHHIGQSESHLINIIGKKLLHYTTDD